MSRSIIGRAFDLECALSELYDALRTVQRKASDPECSDAPASIEESLLAVAEMRVGAADLRERLTGLAAVSWTALVGEPERAR